MICLWWEIGHVTYVYALVSCNVLLWVPTGLAVIWILCFSWTFRQLQISVNSKNLSKIAYQNALHLLA